MRLLVAILLSLSFAFVMSGKGGHDDPYKDYDEVLFMDLDLDSNLMLPAVDKKGHPGVTSYINRVATDLAKQKFTVDLLRDDEVILVTVPSDELFLPNDTLLSPGAVTRLSPIIRLLNPGDMFKVVYGVHTDNTGSEFYNMELAHKRNGSIYDYLLDTVNDDQIVIPYEYGDTAPIESNNTRRGRQANRRIEFYLIPGPRMITLAREGKLK
ncbi:MAG: OmpA family protein [Duncaniella sp.]|nr:OmpA family protein [Duncaniella sp.]